MEALSRGDTIAFEMLNSASALRSQADEAMHQAIDVAAKSLPSGPSQQVEAAPQQRIPVVLGNYKCLCPRRVADVNIDSVTKMKLCDMMGSNFGRDLKRALHAHTVCIMHAGLSKSLDIPVDKTQTLFERSVREPCEHGCTVRYSPYAGKRSYTSDFCA